MKTEVFILENIQEDRKVLSGLFPLKKFNIKFFDDVSDLASKAREVLPHLVIINLEVSKDNIVNDLEYINMSTANETVIVGLARKEKANKFKKLQEKLINEIWEKPLVGMAIKTRVSQLIENMKPVSYKIQIPVDCETFISSQFKAMGESDIVIKAPIRTEAGKEINVYGDELDKIIGKNKTLKLSSNKYKLLDDPFKLQTLTILGLNNEELKKIRSVILQWEKL
jgi:response regulator RpfG family c-di-GMP phosphodiesterase